MTTARPDAPGHRPGAPIASHASRRPVDVATQHQVEQFLFAEAQLLDEHRYDEWITLFSEDVRYWAPTRRTLTHRERDKEVAAGNETAFFDDDIGFLRGRVRRLTSGVSLAEEPPSRTRRLITNIRVTRHEDDSLGVASNFSVYRSRLERHQDWFIGERFDVLRPVAEDSTGHPFLIAARKIVLEQTTLLAPSISVML
ncbi:aromatic-ring-hydroxylating dioxygenase subunit beta [Amycolatopsis sp. GA6-003]|uniref:aromatic-ring-hydroxylating dioxygenase subunit beta n=1 Tax=Amycolatopsis sp. GA6-003 TaxID=2652444 RepID=UPI00391730C6